MQSTIVLRYCETVSHCSVCKARFPSKRNASDCVWMETGLKCVCVCVCVMLGAVFGDLRCGSETALRELSIR